MTYDELIAYYQDNVPPSGTQPFSPQWNQEFNEWAGTIMSENGLSDWSQLTPDLLDQYEVTGGTQTMPFEQALGNQVINDYVVPDLNADAARRAEAERILASYQPALDASRQTIIDATATDANGQTALFRQEAAASETAAKEQLAALDTQIAALGNNLGAELSARAESLRQQLATLAAGISTYTEAQTAALTQQLAENFATLEAEMASKRAALEAELNSLGAAITEQDVARRAALQTEIAKLTAAQEPVKALRIQGAQQLSTAINLGLQAQKDSILADLAQQGFIGGSSASDAALMRATIGARQDAARAMTDAQLQNAMGDADITKYGAGEERSISDTTTGLNFDLSTYGAGENRALSDFDATTRAGIDRFGSTERRGIASNDAAARLSLNQFDAGETRSLADFGSSGRRAVADLGANDRRGIVDAAAGRKFSLFSNDVQRRLSLLTQPAANMQAEFGARTAADEFGQSGLNRTFRNLSFFDLGAGNAPTEQANRVAPNTTTGDAFENVGAGLVGVGTSIAGANNWWQPSSTKTAPTSKSKYDVE